MTSVIGCDLELWAEGNSFFPKVAFGHGVCHNRNKTRIKVTISLVFLCVVITIISHKSECHRAGEVMLSGGNKGQWQFKSRFASRTVIMLEDARPEELSEGRDMIQVNRRPRLKPRLPSTLLITPP